MAATAAEVVSQYPPPPAYYKQYTQENLERNRRRKEGKDVLEDREHPALSLDPPPVIEGNYMMFGEHLTTSDEVIPLRDLGIPQLFEDDCDKVAELKKLNKSLIVNFLELTDYLINRPLEAHFKLEHIRLILINIHFLLNRYRPHQARDTLRLLMERQIKRRRKMTDAVKSCCEDVMGTLKDIYKNTESASQADLMDTSGSEDTESNQKKMDVTLDDGIQTQKSIDQYWEQHQKLLVWADQAAADSSITLM
ncbi:Mediator of RNA polymerase II transcription subunit 7 [Dinochytrium kinnereticum]|nr:Mediator of RNA polymerase II transcription subunit 7 [Dinochytrium kinnereticum]